MSKDSSGEWISDKEWWGYPVTKPTQAQIEELAIEAIKDELDFQRSKGSEKAIGLEWALNRLLAAADVGEFPEPTVEQIEARWERKFKGAADNIRGSYDPPASRPRHADRRIVAVDAGGWAFHFDA